MSTSSLVAAPPRRMMTRVVIPCLITAGAIAAVLWAGWSTFAPAVPVTALQVVVRANDAASTGGGSGGGAGTSRGTAGASSSGRTIQAPGWVEPAPFPVMVSALTPGIVKDVLVLEGERVTEGQPLLTLYSEEQEIALRMSEASFAEQEAKRNEMADELRRKTGLLKSGAVAEADVVRLGLRVEAMNAGVEAARADRDMKQLALERTTVRAPHNGVVMARFANPGMSTGTMQDGKALLELYDPASLQVRADVPLADAGTLAPGQTAEIRVDVLPNRTFVGTVTRIVHQADIAKNTVQAKIQITDPAPELKPDMLARVRISVGARAGGGSGNARSADSSALSTQVWAPMAGLRRESASTAHATALVVANLRGDVGVAELRQVSLAGDEVAGWAPVESGLRAGDLLISTSGAQPQPGQRVRVDLNALRSGGDHANH